MTNAPTGPGTPVGLLDVADIFGVTRQAVYHWIAHCDFPKPSITVNRTTRLWSWGKVEAWAAARGVQKSV